MYNSERLKYEALVSTYKSTLLLNSHEKEKLSHYHSIN